MSTNDAGALPAHWYFEGEPFQQERRTVFAFQWQLFARADALQEPGDFVTANLGGWPLLALCDERRQVGVFRNVCRHQAMQVMEKPKGRCQGLRCRYHGWEYDLQGRFAGAPPMVAPEDPASPNNDLYRIASGTWCGFVFSNLDRNAPPVDHALADLGQQLGAGMRFETEIVTDFNGNWKTLLEHFFASRPDHWRWHWPTLGVEATDWGAVVQQIIPRTFSRSRVVEHVFANPSVGRDEVAAGIEALKARAATDKATCAALQAEREGGSVPAGHERLAELHRRVRAAHERAPMDDKLPIHQ